MNSITELNKLGQSLWLDYVDRTLIRDGQLEQLVRTGQITGLTSNPSIFEKAISRSSAYDDQIRQILAATPAMNPERLFEMVAVKDIQDAADILRPIHNFSRGRDGYVSFEVSPNLAYDMSASLSAATRLFKLIGRSNVFIKIPATAEGLPAVRRAIGEGINVNITLMFSQKDYEDVAEAYLGGLEDRLHLGGDIKSVASVASFFVSRIDTAIDRRLPPNHPLQGKIAIANAKLAYKRYQEIFNSPRFKALKQKGAMVQRVLWASTGTKSPAYPDVYYVESLIGPDTINTVPLETLNAFRDHGKARISLIAGVDEARRQIEELKGLGIDLDAVAKQVKAEGVMRFAKDYNALINAIVQKQKAA